MKTIAEHRFTTRDGRGPGSLILRDAGPEKAMRYVTHWRNDEIGGTGFGTYKATLAEGLADFDARVAEEMRLQAAANPSLAPRGPFKVDLWCSPRDAGNDDNITGGDYDSFAEALSELRRLIDAPWTRGWAHAYLDAANGPLMRQDNPVPRAPSDDEDDDLDRSEAAALQGMAFGTAGRNEVYGEDVEDESPRFGR